MDALHSWTSRELESGVVEIREASSEEEVTAALSEFVYSSCYCEENVYMLLKKLSESGLAAPDASDLYVVFVSNPNRKIPIWRQKSSNEVGGLCVWDYHVISIQGDMKREKAVKVWDLDTTLPCPASFQDYFSGAFQPWVSLKPEFARFYRVIAAPVFLRFFASDRRHMRRKDGSWMAPPPPYICLVAEDGAVHNLEEFITMSAEHVMFNPSEVESLLMHQKFGIVLDEAGFKELFK